MTAAKMDPMLMSRIITPTPAKNSDGHERHEQGGVAHGEQHAQGADRERHRSPARPRSAVIIRIRRWPNRSAHAPACRAKIRLGNQMAAVRKPISAASACSARMPVYGIA